MKWWQRRTYLENTAEYVRDNLGMGRTVSVEFETETGSKQGYQSQDVRLNSVSFSTEEKIDGATVDQRYRSEFNPP